MRFDARLLPESFTRAEPKSLRALSRRCSHKRQRGSHVASAEWWCRMRATPYSGPIAGKAFSLLAHANDAPNRILLIGPPHFVTARGVVAPSSSAFATPLGDVAVDVGTVELLRDAGLVTIDDTPHMPEHSLEVELPFLQRLLEDFTIVPLLVGDASPERWSSRGCLASELCSS